MNAVRPVLGFDGANPGSAEGIQAIAPDRYLVRPFYETPAANYRFRFDMRLEVLSERAEVWLDMDWGDERYRALRSTVMHRPLGGQGRWFSARALGDRGQGPLSFRVRLEKGVHHLTLNPKFDHEDLLELVRDCRDAARVRILERGISGQDSTLRAFHLSSGGAPKPTVLAVARLHPYETAGSHCLAGLVRRVAEDGPGSRELLANRDWMVIPVASAPGVTQGYCRCSGAGEPGLDLSRQADPSDPVCAAILGVAHELRLCGYLDIHNWMHPDADGVYALNRCDTWRFMWAMRRRRPSPRPWRTEHRRFLLARRPEGLMSLIRQRARVPCCGLEYSWHGRDVEDMAGLGVASAEAFGAILEKSWLSR